MNTFFSRIAVSNENGDVVIGIDKASYLSHIVFKKTDKNLSGDETIIATVTTNGITKTYVFNIKNWCESPECQNGTETIIYLEKGLAPVNKDSTITVHAYYDKEAIHPMPNGTYTYNPCIAENPTIYMAGDSTAQKYSSSDKAFPQTGWPQLLCEYLDGTEVLDLARSGRSSRSYLNDDEYKRIENEIDKGDYFIIQFGHNDQKDDPKRHTSSSDDRFTDGSFKKILTENYVNLSLNKNAHPLLTTSVSRRDYGTEKHESYINATRELGRELGIPVIDIYTHMREYIDRVGLQNAINIFLHTKPFDSRFMKLFERTPIEGDRIYDGSEDNSHINYYGAKLIAKWFCDELKRLSHPLFSRRSSYVFKESDIPSFENATSLK